MSRLRNSPLRPFASVAYQPCTVLVRRSRSGQHRPEAPKFQRKRNPKGKGLVLKTSSKGDNIFLCGIVIHRFRHLIVSKINKFKGSVAEWTIAPSSNLGRGNTFIRSNRVASANLYHIVYDYISKSNSNQLVETLDTCKSCQHVKRSA